VSAIIIAIFRPKCLLFFEPLCDGIVDDDKNSPIESLLHKLLL
jgi:hypothetical protein